MGLVQIGVFPTNDGLPPFLNWARHFSGNPPWLRIGGVVKDGADIASRVDSNYNLTDTSGCSEFGIWLFQTPQSGTGNLPRFGGQKMIVKWDGGSAVTGVSGFSLVGLTVNLGAKSAYFYLGSTDQGNTAIWWTLDGSNGGPTNIRIYEESKAADLEAGKVSDPAWLSVMGRYGSLRSMDLQSTNNSEAVNYSDLGSTSHMFWGGVSTANKFKVGWPIAAVFIAYLNANPTATAWINIPHKFTDSATTSLLTAIRDGVTDWSFPRLKIEYSNEIWNGQFQQTGYADTQSGLNTDAFGNAGGWISEGGGRTWSGYRAAQHMEIARTVFGTDSGTKWEGVLASQTAQAYITYCLKLGVDRHISSDAGAANNITKIFTYLAVTTYFGPVVLGFINTLAVTNGGSGYVNGTYNNVPLTGGNGQYQATANITVSGGVVTVAVPNIQGAGYFDNDVLSAAAANLGGTGSGLVLTATGVDGGLGVRTLTGWTAGGQEYFNQQFYDALKLGAGDPYGIYGIDVIRAYWSAHKAYADAWGLQLNAYEGGAHILTITALENTSPLVPFLIAFGRSAQRAQLEYEIANQFIADSGGGMPSCFVVIGSASKYGPWGRYEYYGQYAAEPANAMEAVNLGIPYRQGYRNVRTH